MLKRGGLIFLATGTAVVILVASLLSATDKQSLHIQGVLHPWLHFLAFGFLTVLLLMSVSTIVLRSIFVLAVLLLAFGTEWVEHLRIKAPIETLDIITDAGGVVAGWFAVSLRK